MLAPLCSLAPVGSGLHALSAWLWCARFAFAAGWMFALRRGVRFAPLVLTAIAGFALAMDRGTTVLSATLRDAAATGETRVSMLITVAGIPRVSDTEVSFPARVRAVEEGLAGCIGRCRTLEVRLGRALLAPAGDGPSGAWFPAPGDVLSCTGRLYLPDPQMNPYEPDSRRTLVDSGVAARCRLETADRRGARPADLVRYAPLRFAAWCYRRLDALLEQSLEPAAAALSRALLLGDKTGLGAEERLAFERTGALHLLAVSGLHAGLFAGFVGWAAGLARIGPRPRVWLISLALGTYVLVTGSGPAVLRAATMSLAALWRPRSRQGGQSLGYLGAAGLLLLAADPLSVADPGFQLSFLASLGILTWPVLLRGVHGGVAANLGAQVCTVPVVLHRFYRFCPYGPVTGLVLLPLGALMITCLFGTALAGMLCPPVFVVLAPVINLLLGTFLALAGLLGRLPGSLLTTGHPAPAVAGCVLAAVVVVSLLPAGRRTPVRGGATQVVAHCPAVFALAAVCLLCLHAAGRHLPPSEPTVAWFSVGQGDCALIQAGQKAVLVDFGPPGPPGSTAGDRFSRSVLPYLTATRCRPCLGVLSHPHADHIGGMARAMAAFPEMVVVTRAAFSAEVRAWAPQDACGAARLVFLEGPVRSDLGVCGRGPSGHTAQLELFSAPVPGPAEDLNEMSLLCRLTLRSMLPQTGANAAGLVLFAGDLGEQGETSLLRSASAALEAKVLKVGHHGSGGSSTTAFLRTVAAELAVISVGANRFGHPSGEAVSRIALSGCAVLRTDEAGWIQARFEDRAVFVSTFRAGDRSREPQAGFEN